MNEKEKIPQEARDESPITGAQLMAEIAPLVKEYFIGEVVSSDGSVLYTLPNGQKFRLTAKEEK